MNPKYISFVVGLVIGLMIAAVFAFYITKAPLPFMDKLNANKKESEKIYIDSENNLLKLQNSGKSSYQDKFPFKQNNSNKVLENFHSTTKEKIDLNHNREINNKIYYLQVGSYKNINNADLLKIKIKNLLGVDAEIKKVKNNDHYVNRVLIGPFIDFKEIDSIQQILNKNNIQSTMIIKK